MVSLVNTYFAVIPISVVTIAVVYRYLKLPKQDPNLVRHMLYRKNEPVVIGHRAGAFEGPENTLAAIKTAKQNGATAVEIDLDFTKDGVPIIFHDDDVNRTTDGTGKVSQMSFKNIEILNAAVHHNYTITKSGKQDLLFEKVPTLTEAAELCMKYDMLVDLDVKADAAKTVKALKALSVEHPNASKYILVTSFFPDIIYHVRKECPEYHTGLIWRYNFVARTIAGEPRFSWYATPVLDVVDKLWEVLIHSIVPDFLGVSTVVMHKNHLSKRYVKQWRDKGFEVVAWTVNSPIEKNHLLKNLGVPIITDSLLDRDDCQEQRN